MNERKRPSLGIQSVEIGLEVLEKIVDKGGPISLTELSRATAMQPSKLHRYLVSLGRGGLVSQSALNGLYDLGPAARRLGAAAFNRFDSFGLAQDRVTTLAGELGQTTLLFIWTEHGPTLMRVQNGVKPPPMLLRIGSSLPIRLSAVGYVFMAYLPPKVTAPLIDRQQTDSDEAALADDELSSTLEQIRNDGHFWSATPILPNSELFAVPVFEGRDQLHSVIAVVVPRRDVRELDKAGLIAAVVRAARELSAELGQVQPVDAKAGR